jgi:hypothetical protein
MIWLWGRAEKDKRSKKTKRKGWVMNTGNKTNKADNVVTQHIVEKRFGKNVTTGAFVGRLIDGVIVVGWSRVNIGAKDKFDTKEAANVANYNALMGNPVPETMHDEYCKFVLRCEKYFKGAKLGYFKGMNIPAKDHQRIINRANKLNKEFDKTREVQKILEETLEKHNISKDILKGSLANILG